MKHARIIIVLLSSLLGYSCITQAMSLSGIARSRAHYQRALVSLAKHRQSSYRNCHNCSSNESLVDDQLWSAKAVTIISCVGCVALGYHMGLFENPFPKIYKKSSDKLKEILDSKQSLGDSIGKYACINDPFGTTSGTTLTTIDPLESIYKQYGKDLQDLVYLSRAFKLSKLLWPTSSYNYFSNKHKQQLRYILRTNPAACQYLAKQAELRIFDLSSSALLEFLNDDLAIPHIKLTLLSAAIKQLNYIEIMPLEEKILLVNKHKARLSNFYNKIQWLGQAFIDDLSKDPHYVDTIKQLDACTYKYLISNVDEFQSLTNRINEQCKTTTESPPLASFWLTVSPVENTNK